jgi:secreted trypsin-like serine protease
LSRSINDCGCAPALQVSRIFNGGIAKENSAPYQAFIATKGGGYGGGTILNKRYVLTAAHNVNSNQNAVPPKDVKSFCWF